MEKTQVDLSNYRLEKARSDLETAAENLEKKRFSQSIGNYEYALKLTGESPVDFKKDFLRVQEEITALF